MGNGTVEREINLWDMFWAVCLKWRSICVCAVILSILVSATSYYMGAKEVERSADALTIGERMTLEEKRAVDYYLQYVNMYEEQLYYNENAPIMNLDANNLYRGEIDYYIDNHYEVEYPQIEKTNNIVALVNAYKSAVDSEEFAEIIGEKLSLEGDNAYGMELVSFDVQKAKEGVLTFVVYAREEETCTALKEIVKKMVDEKKNELVAQFGEHDIILSQDTQQVTSDADILNHQKTNIDRLQSYITVMTNMKIPFTKDQLLYAELSTKEIQEDKGAITDGTLIQKNTVSVKIFVVGFLGGAFLAFVVWLLAYVLSNKLRVEEDFEYVYGQKLLGNVPMDDKKRRKCFAVVDDFFVKMRHFNKRYFKQEEALDMVEANIRIAMQKNNSKKLMLTGSFCEGEMEDVFVEIEKRLRKHGIEIICASSVLYNAEALEILAGVENVVLIEKAEESLQGEVQREIEVCDQQNVNLVGCVVVY